MFFNLKWQFQILAPEILCSFSVSLSPSPSSLLTSVSFFLPLSSFPFTLILSLPYHWRPQRSTGMVQPYRCPSGLSIIRNPDLSNLRNRSCDSTWRIFSQPSEHTKYQQNTQNYQGPIFTSTDKGCFGCFLLHFLQLLLLKKQSI